MLFRLQTGHKRSMPVKDTTQILYILIIELWDRMCWTFHKRHFFKVRPKVGHTDMMVPPIGNSCLTGSRRGRNVDSRFNDCIFRYEFTDVNMYTHILITGGKNEIKDMTVQVSSIVNRLSKIT